MYPQRGGDAECAPEEGADAVRLINLLAFADAVGSCRGVVDHCCELRSLRVQLGEEVAEIPIEGAAHSLSPSSTSILWRSLGGDAGKLLTGAVVSHDKRSEVRAQMVAQLEPLLHLAYRLGIDGLQQLLHDFMHVNCLPDHAFLDFGLLSDEVFTDRVLAAADRGRMRKAWMRDVLVRPLGPAGDGAILSGFDWAAPTVELEGATVARACIGAAADALVGVRLDMDEMKAWLYHPLQIGQYPRLSRSCWARRGGRPASDARHGWGLSLAMDHPALVAGLTAAMAVLLIIARCYLRQPTEQALTKHQPVCFQAPQLFESCGLCRVSCLAFGATATDASARLSAPCAC